MSAYKPVFAFLLGCIWLLIVGNDAFSPPLFTEAIDRLCLFVAGMGLMIALFEWRETRLERSAAYPKGGR